MLITINVNNKYSFPITGISAVIVILIKYGVEYGVGNDNNDDQKQV